MTYAQQLLDERWLTLRDKVIKRDDHKCRYCLRPSDLQVHHMKYESGKMAWEYPMDVLLTLCRGCHANEHGKGYKREVYNPDGHCRPVRTIREVMIDAIREQLRMLHNG